MNVKGFASRSPRANQVTVTGHLHDLIHAEEHGSCRQNVQMHLVRAGCRRPPYPPILTKRDVAALKTGKRLAALPRSDPTTAKPTSAHMHPAEATHRIVFRTLPTNELSHIQHGNCLAEMVG